MTEDDCEYLLKQVGELIVELEVIKASRDRYADALNLMTKACEAIKAAVLLSEASA